ncbi:MAG: DUF4974 domain-containing protein [Tannerellaceae bacterium]|jgi:ferric-dicitrate binding protein FerR (iron transport regulator)|nr:DUF4974 domain-containing protein [Tannerellaceae bacterium]
MEQAVEMNETTLWNYFAGALTPEERRAVERRMAESEAFRALARDMQYLYRATDMLHTVRQVQVQAPAALRRVKKQIRRRRLAGTVRWAQRVAAILFVPLLIAAVYRGVKEEPAACMSVHSNPGTTACLDLPDGSRVWLNSGSTLRYPVKFQGDTREVEIAGEAYFRVAKDGKRKFVVSAGHQVKVEVLGTEFNIEAYPDDGFIAATLIKGSISLRYAGSGKRQESLVMQPDRKVFYYTHTQSIRSVEAYAPTDIAWMEGKIAFRNTPLETVLKKLSHRFNVNFIIRNESIRQYSFTGTFDGQQLVQILEHFRISSGIRYRITEPSPGGTDVPKRGEVILY